MSAPGPGEEGQRKVGCEGGRVGAGAIDCGAIWMMAMEGCSEGAEARNPNVSVAALLLDGELCLHNTGQLGLLCLLGCLVACLWAALRGAADWLRGCLQLANWALWLWRRLSWAWRCR